MFICIVSQFSQQIATSNGGPALALESIVTKLSISCDSLNWSTVQPVSKIKFCLGHL